MTRKKVPLQFITNDSSRKITFKKRKKGLMKKVNELSTLCGIEACAIVFSPFDNEPEVWPSALHARRTVARFRNMSEMDRSKGMVNQQGFLRQRIGKAEAQLKKQQRENREKEVTQVMYQKLAGSPAALQGLNLSDLNELDCVVGKTILEIEERMGSLQKTPEEPPPPSGNINFLSHHQGQEGVQQEERKIGSGSGSGSGNFDGLVMEAMQNQPWYLELLKPSETLGGFSRNEEVMPMPPPFPSTGQMNVSPWTNFFSP